MQLAASLFEHSLLLHLEVSSIVKFYNTEREYKVKKEGKGVGGRAGFSYGRWW